MALFESGSTPAPDVDKAIRMLELGQELMIQLRCLLLLQLPEQEWVPDSCWVLLDDISGSLGLSLSALRSGLEQPRDVQLRGDRAGDDQMIRNDKSRLFPENEPKSKCSSRKKKRCEPMITKGDDDRKKRKRVYSSTTITAAPYDDGYLWRKYGQKVIRGAKHPRSYFRCTYSNELNCPATKQVQQTDSDDPPMFLTICTHKHTCSSGRTAPHVVVEPTPAERFSLSYVPRSTAATASAGRHHPSAPTTELGEQLQGSSPNETWATSQAGADLFSSASESASALAQMGQFLMNTPDHDGEAQLPAGAAPPSPDADQMWEIEGLVDSLLGN